MADLSLRAYLKEIDELTEREQLDEAIAHSRHILETYPKHLDTYRLLGKAYLEAKRYGDAADIFQRVLSAVPDDFVSQVGMSIVREDEGNIDSAIWHMERAFETSPANPAIQQELRRLIGRRDGIEPHKVRLTRGALARMYAQGELYPQAAAELRSALQEDPDRPDLQVALAEMYWKTGQRPEAVDLCTRILEKLPYCREANRILASAYQSAGKSPEATPYHRRLAMLDPYAAFVENAMVDPRAVDPGSVHIERLEWYPGLAVPTTQPDWASTLGSQPKPEHQASGAMPGWLESLESERAAKAAPVQPTPPPAAAEPATTPFAAGAAPQQIPDWMTKAGWQESTGAAKEGPISFSDSELAGLEAGVPPEPPASGEAELAPAELPDWVRAIAPRDVPSAPPPAPEPPASLGEESVPDWLEEARRPTPPTPEASGEAPKQATPLGMFPAETGPVPEWLDKPADGATETIVTWLGDRRAPELRRSASGKPPAAAQPEEPTPAPEEPAEPEVAQPAWLSAMAQAAEETPPEPEPEAEAPPAWLSGITEAAAQQEPLKPEDLDFLRQRAQPEEAAPTPDEAWLAQLEAADEVEPAQPRQAPDWLREPAATEPPPEAAPADEWLRGLSGPEPAAEPPPLPEPPRGPEWLQGIPAAPPSSAAEVPGDDMDWLRGIAEPEEPAPEPAGGLDWLRGLAGAEEPVPQAEGQDWLKDLAEQGVPEETTQETPVDWLRLPKEEPPPTPAPPPAAPAGGEAETPAWLQEFAAAGAPSAPEPMPVPDAPAGDVEPEFEGVLDWLREPAKAVEPEPALPPAASSGAPAPAMPDEGEDDALRWLEGLAARQAAEPVAADLPPFMAEKPEPPAPRGLPPEEPEEGLEWLEKLAAERGLEAELEPAADRSARRPPQPAAPPPAKLPPVSAPAAEPVPTQRATGSLAPAGLRPAAAVPAQPVEQPPSEKPAEWARPAQPSLHEGEAPLAWRPIDTTPVASEKAVPIPPESEPADEVPDWLKAIAADTAPGSEPLPEPPVEPPVEEPLWQAGAPIEEDVGWLAEAAAEVSPEPAELPEEAFEAELTPEAEVPAWFAGVPEPAESAPAPLPEEPELVQAEIPEWLQAAAPAEIVEPPLAAPEAEEPVAVEEPIPDWLWTAGEVEPEARRAPVEPEPLEEVAPATPAPPPPLVLEPEPAPGEAPAPQPAVVEPPLVEAPAAEPAPPPAPARPSKPAPPRAKPGPAAVEVLAKARRALAAGDLENALAQYGGLIKKRRELDAVVEDLRAVLVRSPREAAVWQALGDAYMKADRLQEALEAYKRGLESA